VIASKDGRKNMTKNSWKKNETNRMQENEYIAKKDEKEVNKLRMKENNENNKTGRNKWRAVKIKKERKTEGKNGEGKKQRKKHSRTKERKKIEEESNWKLVNNYLANEMDRYNKYQTKQLHAHAHTHCFAHTIVGG